MEAVLEVLLPEEAVPAVTLAKGVRVHLAAAAAAAAGMALAVVELEATRMLTAVTLQSTVEPERTAAALAKLNFSRIS